MGMPELSSLENAVLTKLLDGEHPVLETLRAQLESCEIESRDCTGVGIYLNFHVLSEAPILRGIADFHIGDVIADIPGLSRGAGFVLFVKGGRLSFLEGYSYGEPWPQAIDQYRLRYAAQPRVLPLSTSWENDQNLGSSSES